MPVLGLTVASAPGLAYRLQFLQPLATSNGLGSGLAQGLVPALVLIIVVVLAVWLTTGELRHESQFSSANAG